MILSEFDGHLFLFEIFVTPITHKYIARFNYVSTTICLHINQKTHMVSDFIFIVKNGSSLGHRLSRTLQKWNYFSDSARDVVTTSR